MHQRETRSALLHKAIEDRNHRLVKEMVSAGHDINLIERIDDDINHTQRDETPLITAARLGNQETAMLLLDLGADVNLGSPGTGMTALHWACAKGHSDLAWLLLQRNANVNRAEYRSETALLEAICSESVDIVRMLVFHGADMESPVNSSQDTSLMFALQTGKVTIARFLIAAGANMASVNSQGEDIIASLSQSQLTGDDLKKMLQFIHEAGYVLTSNHYKLFEENDAFSSIREHLPAKTRTLKSLSRVCIRRMLSAHRNDTCLITLCHRLPLPIQLQKYIAMFG